MYSNGPIGEHSKPSVTYFCNRDFGSFVFTDSHPMKPIRVAMTDELIQAYGLNKLVTIKEVKPVSELELCRYHHPDFIKFMKKTTDVTKIDPEEGEKYGFEESGSDSDCPAFDRMFDFATTAAAGSLAAAKCLNNAEAGIAISWMGGLHHAKKASVSGFCYVNDIVLAILELLTHHKRVLYVDIDCHHGDAVQAAFYNTDRVLTASFHQYCPGFFPGTGAVREKGIGSGVSYSVNVPLAPGASDITYHSLFKEVMAEIIMRFEPCAIVLQCGADSLAEDRLGDFNLSMSGHGECVRYLRKFNIPLMLLGGGGYTVENTARCWTFETAIAVNVELPDTIPDHKYSAKYGKKKLYLQAAPKVKDSNEDSREMLKAQVLESLRGISAPSVQMQPARNSISPLENDEYSGLSDSEEKSRDE